VYDATPASSDPYDAEDVEIVGRQVGRRVRSPKARPSTTPGCPSMKSEAVAPPSECPPTAHEVISGWSSITRSAASASRIARLKGAGDDGDEIALFRDRPSGRSVGGRRHLPAGVQDQPDRGLGGRGSPREPAVRSGFVPCGRCGRQGRFGLGQQWLRSRPPEEPDDSHERDDDDRRETADGDASSPRSVQIDPSVEVDGGVVGGLRIRGQTTALARDRLVDAALGHGVAPFVSMSARGLRRAFIGRQLADRCIGVEVDARIATSTTCVVT
jgi:hypothetical protein